MILSMLIILAQTLLGNTVVSWAGIKASQSEKFLFSIISGFLIGSWILFLLNILLGLHWTTILVGIILMLLISSPRIKEIKIKISVKSIQNQVKKNKIVSIFFASVFFVFLYLHYTHYLEPKSDGLYSGGGTWGDIAIHLSIITSFVENSNSKIEYPVYLGVPLTYNFMVDFATAAWVAGGLAIRDAFVLMGVILSISSFLLFYFLAKNITRNSNIAIVATLLVLFTGGLGFIYFLEDKTSNLSQFRDYTNYPEKGINFWNLVGSILLPQRAYMAGFAVVFLIINSLWRWFDRKANPKELIFSALIMGLLPLFNWHIFLSVGIVSFILFLIDLFLEKKKLNFISERLRLWIIFFSIVTIFSLPQVFWTFSQVIDNVGKSFLALQLGWVAKDQNWLLFWIFNLGFLFVLSLPAFILAERKLKIFYLPFAALFFIANIFRFQPWDMDNLKIFYMWIPLNSILIASLLYSLFKKGIPYKIFFFAIVLISISSGFLSVARETQLSWMLFDNQDIELASWVRENTPKDSIFLTSSHHNHFVPTLAGRKIVMGYEGWLWVYGINYDQRKNDVEELFSGTPESLNMVQKYNVDYIVIGPKETSMFSINDSFFLENFEVVKQQKDVRIFKINRI